LLVKLPFYLDLITHHVLVCCHKDNIIDCGWVVTRLGVGKGGGDLG
jgi:hypothetical protein